ncbi:MAG: carboxylating nicotinate-nucleotide diphosphorylase [Candidatus Sumerlaeia bacterium]|nr:carboxylating nicotinate-nucleotide diphosphorylase [Candidatus Sumerlaeia bacterium]
MSRQIKFPSLRDRIRLALAEDLADAGDITTQATFSPDARTRAIVVAREKGVFSGTEVFRMVFEEVGGVTVSGVAADGTAVAPGDTVATLEGTVRGILAGERTALNFIQRLSGVASLTAKFVQAADGRIKICDTRKTTPLWRDLEKAAVVHGGGTNHRMGLYDMAMLKDTHADGCGSLKAALERVASLKGTFAIAAEARDMDEVQAAIDGGADLLMLDNMPRKMLVEAVALVAGRVETEITGGVTLETIGDIAGAGVDRVSIGALTHSAPALDFSLRLVAGRDSQDN